LTDDAIHLSLSPTRLTPANNLNTNSVVDVTASTELSKVKKYNNGSTVLKKELSAGDLTNNYELTFRAVPGNGKTTMQRSTSWYDGFFGCLKPVWSFMGKNKPSNLQDPSEGKIPIYSTILLSVFDICILLVHFSLMYTYYIIITV
jgi:hypothetical protein